MEGDWDMNRGKSLFWLMFVILLSAISAAYSSIYVWFIPWDTSILSVLLFLVAIVPLTAFLSERLVKFAIRKGLDRNRAFMPAIIILPISLFAFVLYIDYREKGLDDVIEYDTENFEYLIIDDRYHSDNKEKAEGLRDFFGVYRVVKMRDRDWDSDVSKENGFTLTIYSKGKPLVASVYENRVHSDTDYYRVINGPIDLERMGQIFDEHR